MYYLPEQWQSFLSFVLIFPLKAQIKYLDYIMNDEEEKIQDFYIVSFVGD